MNKKIFITRKIPNIAVTILKEKGYEVDVYPKDKVPKQGEIIKYLKKGKYDAVITLLTDKIDQVVFDASPSTKIFANYAIGFDNIDLAEAKKRGIYVTNAPGDYSGCVAEHAMAMIMDLSIRMSESDRYVRNGKYKGWSPMNFIGNDISGKTLGIIGVGKIGEHLAGIAIKGFNMKVVYYDVRRNEALEKVGDVTHMDTIEEVLKRSDFVSLHVPLLDSTRHLINESSLKMMKPGSFLINTSRGPVIDENALVKALQNKTIKGAGLDVFEFEPKLAKGLAKLDNVILTPHIASARESARNEMAKTAAQNVIDCLEGSTPRNAV
jgi:glyoxylate reductase